MKHHEDMNHKKEAYFENDYASYWIENGIVYEVFKPHITKIDLKIAKQVVADRLKVTDGIVRPVLIDLMNLKIVDKEAREYLAGGDAVHLVSASAFIINSYVLLVLGKLFLSVNKPEIRVELFKSQSKAAQWLENYKFLN